MRYGVKVAFSIAAGMGLHLSAYALNAADNPYNPIVDRNVFSLRPILVVDPTNNVPPPPPPTKVTLLGIVSYLGKAEVIFKTMASSKPGEAPKETTFSLGVKELQGDFEVVEIDHIAGTVRLKNHGIEQALSLEKDGMKPAGGGGGAPAPGAPGLPGVPPIPGAAPAPTAPTAAGVSRPNVGGVQRPLRVPTTTSAAGNNGQPAQAPIPSVEEQVIQHAIQTKLNQSKVDSGEIPPLPPLPGQ